MIDASTKEDQRGMVVWFTGLSGAGKSTLASAVLRRLTQAGIACELLDADEVRRTLGAELGFGRADREENVRRLGFVGCMLARHGVVTLVAAMSPYRQGREAVREAAPGFLEVFVDAPLAVCEARDPKGIYRRFRLGELRHLSGLDEIYEAPDAPEIHCCTAVESLEESGEKVFARILEERTKGY